MTALANYYLGCYSIQNSVSLSVVRNENIVSVASCISFCQQSASSPNLQPTITAAGVTVFAPSILQTNIATCFCWSDSTAILKSKLDPINCGACLDAICGLRGTLSTSYAVYSLAPVIIPAPPDPATAVTSSAVDTSAIFNVGGTIPNPHQPLPTSEATSPDMGQPTFVSTLNPSLPTSDTFASAVINPMVMTPTESPMNITSTTSTITKPTATTTMKMASNPIQNPTTATMGGGGGGAGVVMTNNTSTTTTAMSERSVTLSTSPFSVFLIAVIVLGTVVGLMFTIVPYYYYYYHDKYQRLFSFTSSGNSKNGSYININNNSTNTNSNPRPRFRDLLPATTPLMQGPPISPTLTTPTTPTQLIRPNAPSPKSGSASPPVPPKISTSPTSPTTTTPTNHAFNNSQFTITNLVSTTVPSPSLASQSMILTSPSLASSHMRDSISVAGGGAGGAGPGSEVASTLTIESSIAVGNSGLYRFPRAGGPVVVLFPPEYPPPVALPESSS